MDEIADYFQEFIKKSLVLISIALGTLILMIMYVFKLMAQRPSRPRTLCNANLGLRSSKASLQTQSGHSYVPCKACNSNQSNLSKENSVTSNLISENSINSNPCQVMDSATSNTTLTPKTASTSAQVTSYPKFDKKVLREIGLSGCSKTCRGRKPTEKSSSASMKSRTGSKASSVDRCKSKTPTKYLSAKTSCCSTCCADTGRR